MSRWGVEVQGELVAGHRSERFGAAHVQRRGRPEVGEPGGPGREGGVQVQGVGQVDLGLHPHGALEGHLVRVHVRVPAVGGGLPAAAGLIGHEPHDRLLDQPVHAAGADPVREPRDLVVHEPRRRERQGDRGAGDPAGPPRRQVPGPDPGPGAREPVPQLEGLPEVGLAGLGGQPDRGRELGHTELRHQRRTGTGDRDRGVTEPDRVTDRLRRVQARPRDRVGQQPRLGGVRGGTVGTRLREHPSSGIRCCVEAGAGSRAHGPILVEQVFESRTESVEFGLGIEAIRRWSAVWRGFRDGCRATSSTTAELPPRPPPSCRGPSFSQRLTATWPAARTPAASLRRCACQPATCRSREAAVLTLAPSRSPPPANAHGICP